MLDTQPETVECSTVSPHTFKNKSDLHYLALVGMTGYIANILQLLSSYLKKNGHILICTKAFLQNFPNK